MEILGFIWHSHPPYSHPNSTEQGDQIKNREDTTQGVKKVNLDTTGYYALVAGYYAGYYVRFHGYRGQKVTCIPQNTCYLSCLLAFSITKM